MKNLCLFCFLFLSITAFSQTPDLLSQTSEVNNLMVNFNADRATLGRFYFVNSSPERRERLRKLYNDYLTQLNALPYESLSIEGKVDFLLFRRDLEAHLYWSGVEEKEVNQLSKLVTQAEPIYAAEKKRRRGEVMNWQELAKQWNDVNKTITAAMGKLSSEPNYTRALANRAEQLIKGQQEALKSVFEFYDGYDPQFTWWVKKPFGKLDTTLPATPKR